MIFDSSSLLFELGLSNMFLSVGFLIVQASISSFFYSLLGTSAFVFVDFCDYSFEVQQSTLDLTVFK